MKPKVLILCPHLSEKGGVAFYYSLVKKHFASKKVDIDFFHTGKHGEISWLSRISRSLADLLSLTASFPRYDLVLLNPSLDPKAVIRDGILHLMAKKVFGKKTMVFFRGWAPECERFIDKHARAPVRYFLNADRVIVLSGRFREVLVRWGFSLERIVLETTTFEHHEFNGYEKSPLKMVFLSRLSRAKGCLEAIQAVEVLSREFSNVELHVIGDGELTTDLKDYVRRSNLGNTVRFAGWLDGKEKYHLLSQCGIMIYPTSYGEGMPNCVLEAMGMGVAVITRPVGGIVDVLVDGKNGFLIDSLDPKEFAAKARYLIQNRNAWQTVSNGSRQQAMENFEIKNVVKRLESLFLETVQ